MLSVYNILEIFIAVVSVILNCVVIAVIVKRKHLHTPNNVMIGHLATADVIVGLLVVPSAIVSNMRMDMDFDDCVLLNSVIIMFTNVPVLILMCVTAIRFIAVRYPLVYKYSLNTKRVICIGGFAWVLGILLGLVPIAWNNPEFYKSERNKSKCNFLAVIPPSYLVYFDAICMFSIPVLTMALVYTYIGCKVKTIGNSTEETKTIQLFVFITLVHFVVKFPLQLLNCLSYFHADLPWDKDTGDTMLLAAILLDRSHSIVNPIVYAFGNKTIKKEMPNREIISEVIAMAPGKKVEEPESDITEEMPYDVIGTSPPHTLHGAADREDHHATLVDNAEFKKTERLDKLNTKDEVQASRIGPSRLETALTTPRLTPTALTPTALTPTVRSPPARTPMHSRNTSLKSHHSSNTSSSSSV